MTRMNKFYKVQQGFIFHYKKVGNVSPTSLNFITPNSLKVKYKIFTALSLEAVLFDLN